MQLTEKIHLLKLDFEITLSPEKKLQRFVNSIIIFGKKIMLIDTGAKTSAEEIIGYINSNGRDIRELDTIILSHSHPDHIGSAAKLKKLTGCKVLAHVAEKEWIENIQVQNAERPVPGFFNLVDTSVQVDSFLEHNQILKAEDNITLKIYHSPGHSNGSINIKFEEDGILFTADSIPLKNDIPNYDNYKDLLKSLELIRSQSGYNMMLTSWTPPLTEKQETDRILEEGEMYLKTVDQAVRTNYAGNESTALEFCRKTIVQLGLPPFLAVPVVDKAFRSHLK